jgi:Flp pilus assembly protein TadG
MHQFARPLRHIPGSGRIARFWRRDSEAAQTLVEFSLILPLFLILIFALVDFGRAFFAWQTVTSAAREGARAAAVGGSTSTVDTRIYQSFCTASPYTSSTCSLDPADIAITKTGIPATTGSTVTVTVAYSFSYVTPLSPLLTLIGGSSLSTPTISSTTSMRGE